MIRLPGLTGWYANLLLAYNKYRFSYNMADKNNIIDKNCINCGLATLFSPLVQLIKVGQLSVTDESTVNRGSYMSAHVLLNLLNELGKRDKMRGLQEFNKFNNTRARMLDSIYHMTFSIL